MMIPKLLKLFLALMFILSLTVVPLSSVAAQDPETAWLASYWNDITPGGEPVLQRLEPDVDHQWGYGSPAAGIIPPERFSARWERTMTLPAGQYRFTAIADDGVRVWVNNRLIIDSWQVQPATEHQGDVYLNGGPVAIRVEYFENTGLALIQLTWAPLSDIAQGWYAEYFDNANLIGPPALVREDPAINFDWGAGSPQPNVIAPDTFSVRWSQTLSLEPGRYRFTATADDGIRIWVSDQLILNEWHPQSATIYTREVDVAGGEVPVRVEYYEEGGLAVARVDWQRLGEEVPAPGIPTGAIIVDNDDPGFEFGAEPAGADAAAGWQLEPEGFDGSLLWTVNSDHLPSPYNWGRWTPVLDAGRYEVAVYIPERFSTTSMARYWIVHADGGTLRVVDQSASGGRWVSLGSYEFDEGASGHVTLSDVTFEPSGSRLVAYDAMRFTPVSN